MNFIIESNTTMLEALKIMDKLKLKLLIVMENNLFESVLSIGDIQRAIIASRTLTTPVSEILRKVMQDSSGNNISDLTAGVLAAELANSV